MRKLLARAVAAVPSEAASLLLIDPAGRELVFRASRDVQPGMIDGLRIPTDRGIAGWVARHREAVRLDDVMNDPRHFIEFGRQTGLVPRTMICVPMVSKDTLRGVIQMINKVDGSSFTEAELEHAQTLADHAAIAIENASLYHQAYLASITDDLTGLGNTRHFNRSLTELIGRGGLVSLVIFDLDNFKAVVDGYGHLVGSRTIAQIGRTVARLIRPGDVAARFGGDEFVIVLPDTDAAAALRIAEAIRAAVASTADARRRGRRPFRRDRQRRRRQLSRARRRRGESLPGGRHGDVLREALGKEPRRARGKGGLAFRRRRCLTHPARATPPGTWNSLSQW